MDNTKHGGPAFPLADAQSVHRIGAAAIEGITDSAERDRLYIEATARACAGMTLRDYFAAKAMVGFIADTNVRISNDRECDMAARASYRMADAMLRARGAA
ncbi:hypothetical protein [Burkholderia cenocepacia]|uniref:hypothetical protein n=1 Tax=Burkholderia cenocepacia TaxID=95486 RepID=UPI001B982A74|nr:hypothetical protein [Burkholderia cenocepacia]MBR8136865.1 hypothetical protein [Burkholderia cenocepacia]